MRKILNSIFEIFFGDYTGGLPKYQEPEAPKEQTVVVYFNSEYSQSTSFRCPASWDRAQVMHEVTKRYGKTGFYTFDIWR